MITKHIEARLQWLVLETCRQPRLVAIVTFAEVKQVAGFRRDAAGREEEIRRGMTRSNAAHFLQRDVEWHLHFA